MSTTSPTTTSSLNATVTTARQDSSSDVEQCALAGVARVVFDEFHERSLEADLAMALLSARDLQVRDIAAILRDEVDHPPGSGAIERGGRSAQDLDSLSFRLPRPGS